MEAMSLAERIDELERHSPLHEYVRALDGVTAYVLEYWLIVAAIAVVLLVVAEVYDRATARNVEPPPERLYRRDPFIVTADQKAAIDAEDARRLDGWRRGATVKMHTRG